MRNLMLTLAAAVAAPVAALLAASPAMAQLPDTRCQGRVVVQTVYQQAIAGNRFDYYFSLRNMTGTKLQADVSFSGFAGDVTVFNYALRHIPLEPHTVTPPLKFGTGSNNRINTGTVSAGADKPAPAGPHIRVTNCSAQ